MVTRLEKKPTRVPQRAPVREQPRPPPARPPRSFGRDELSTGRGGRLRAASFRSDGGAVQRNPVGAGSSTGPLFRIGPGGGLTGSPDSIERQDPAVRARAAATRVQEALDSGGPVEAARRLEAEARTFDTPEDVDLLIEAAQPVIDELTATLGERARRGDDSDENPVTRASVEALAAVADLASDAGVAAIVRPLAAALPDSQNLNQLDDVFDALDDDGRGFRLGLALTNELTATGKTATAAAIGREAADALGQLRTDANDARAAREEADARLQGQLAEVERLLSPEQQQAFITEFRERNADVYAEEIETAQRLDAALTAGTPALEQLVAASPAAAGEVLDAFEDLARTPLPAAAAEFAARVTQPGSPAFEAFEEHAERIVEDLVEPALPGVLTQYQTEEGGDASVALERFDELFGRFRTARSLLNAPGDFADSLDQASAFVDATREANAGRPEALRELLSDRDELEGLTPVASGVAAASLGFAVLNLPGQSGADLARAVADVGLQGAELLTRTIGSLETSGRLATLVGESGAASLADSAAFLQGRVLPGLGVALSALGTADAVGDLLNDDATREEVLATVTSAVSLVGSGLALFPATAPVGVALAAGAQLVNLIGQGIFGADDRDAFNQEQEEILSTLLTEELGDTDEVREAARQIAFSSSDMNALMERAGLNTEQLVELMGTVPGANDRHFNDGIALPLATAGLQGDAFVEAVQDVNAELPIEQLAFQVGRTVEAIQTDTATSDGVKRELLIALAESDILGLIR